MEYSFRKLSRNDVRYLRALLGVFGEVFNEPQTYLNDQPREEYLRSLLGKKSFIAIAALSGGEVIGGLTAYQFDKYEQERGEIYIYDLAVAAGHRSKGVATNLINALRRIARRRNVWAIFVQADRGDTAAIKLYESLGKKEAVYSFDIPLQ